MESLRVVILAAGKGTRMRSQLPKVMHTVMGRTLLGHVLKASAPLGPATVIVGHGAEAVIQAHADPQIQWVYQREQKGTGHALQQLLEPWQDYQGRVLVINGDAPLVTTQTLTTLAEVPLALVTATLQDPTGYGRVFCKGAIVQQIIEEKDCTPAQKLEQRINAGVYGFSWPELARALAQLTCNNAQGEYYLTEVFDHLKGVVAIAAQEPTEVLGVNDRLQLAQVGHVLRERITHYWLRAGVTIVDPVTTTIEDTVVLNPDVVIEPGSHLKGQTTIEAGAKIGPGSLIEHSHIGRNAEILYSVVRYATIGPETTVGPYAHLRQGAQTGAGCRVGNFVEIKNSHLGDQTNCAHLSYLGDSTLGRGVNIGCGTVTANYDGRDKHRTIIEDHAKTGSNSVLVAPITIGTGATVGAGSVITKDVPAGSLAVARARQLIKLNWKPHWAKQP